MLQDIRVQYLVFPATGRVRLRSVLQQQLHAVGVAVGGRLHKRVVAMSVATRCVSAKIEEQANHLHDYQSRAARKVIDARHRGMIMLAGKMQCGIALCASSVDVGARPLRELAARA